MGSVFWRALSPQSSQTSHKHNRAFVAPSGTTGGRLVGGAPWGQSDCPTVRTVPTADPRPGKGVKVVRPRTSLLTYIPISVSLGCVGWTLIRHP